MQESTRWQNRCYVQARENLVEKRLQIKMLCGLYKRAELKVINHQGSTTTMETYTAALEENSIDSTMGENSERQKKLIESESGPCRLRISWLSWSTSEHILAAFTNVFPKFNGNRRKYTIQNFYMTSALPPLLNHISRPLFFGLASTLSVECLYYFN